MKSAGIDLLHKLITEQDTKEFHALKLQDSYFTEFEQEAFEFINKHVETYGQLPSVKVYKKALEFPTGNYPEPLDYYIDQLQSRYMKKNIQETLKEVSTIFDQPNVPLTKDVVSKFAEMVLNFNIDLKNQNLFDFRKSAEEIIKNYKQKQLKPDGGIKFGWPSFDNVSGGLVGGDILSVIGRPGAGKSYLLLKMAHYIWRHQKLKPLFITMEMSAEAMFNRLAAIDTTLTINNINKGKLSTKAFQKLQQCLFDMESHKSPFWLLDGSSHTTVDDIVLTCHQLKPDIVFVDGAYLLRHKDKRLDRWARQSENADLLKFKIARDFDIPVALSYQFGRETIKKRSKGGKPGLEDIYGSDNIGQISSIVLGLLQDEEEDEIPKRLIDIIKGREGETGEFIINWDFNMMNFDDVTMQDGDEITLF